MKKFGMGLSAALIAVMANAGCGNKQASGRSMGELPKAASGDAGQSSAGSWKADTSSAPPEVGKSDPSSIKSPPLTMSEQKRYDRVALRLVQAINGRDQRAYRSLFTDEAWSDAIDWWREMFVKQVLKFGKIERAYPPQRGTIRFGKMGMGGDERNGASFVAIFGNKAGGLFSFELNDKDKIVYTSVFIKEELAQYDKWNAKPIFEKGG